MHSPQELGLIHRFVPGAAGDSGPVLLLLHGTGGSEDDLLELGRSIAPGAALLSPRGRVLENGMPRFFRRLAEGVFDKEDLIFRTDELAKFVLAAAGQYRFDPGNVTALGYSNGANIAVSLLLLRPGVLKAALLFRAMVPLVPPTSPDLSGVRVFLSAGEFDPIVPRQGTEALAVLLREAGADITLHWNPAGHQLTSAEFQEARIWLAEP